MMRVAQVRAGFDAYIAGDHEGASHAYMRAAELGYPIAEKNAAFVLAKLDGASAEDAALRYQRRAAADGDGEAMLRIGDAYFYGR